MYQTYGFFVAAIDIIIRWVYTKGVLESGIIIMAVSKVTVLELESKLVAALLELGMNTDTDYAIEVIRRLRDTTHYMQNILHAYKVAVEADRYRDDSNDSGYYEEYEAEAVNIGLIE